MRLLTFLLVPAVRGAMALIAAAVPGRRAVRVAPCAWTR
jgi:hypothetical protein